MVENIVVIDVNSLINNSKHFLEISNKINFSQQEYKNNLKEAGADAIFNCTNDVINFSI